MTSEARHCLVISDGRRGIENQALGLAESCASLRAMTIQIHRIEHGKTLGKALASLPPKAQLGLAKFDLPNCDIAIGCGRQAIAPLLHLKQIRPQVMTIYVQDPRMDPSAFDLVIAPEHDGLSGANVETMIGSPNRVSKEKIIGTHKLDLASHEAHMSAAQKLISKGHSLLIATSRRTPDFAVSAWRRFASAFETAWFHDAEGPNPYFAFLGGADIILVTEDSTNMLTEACATAYGRQTGEVSAAI